MLNRKMTNQKSTLSLLYNILISIGSAVLTVGLILPYKLYPNRDGHPGQSFLFSLNSSNDVYYKFVDIVILLMFVFVLLIFLSGFLALLGRKIKRLSLFVEVKLFLCKISYFFAKKRPFSWSKRPFYCFFLKTVGFPLAKPTPMPYNKWVVLVSFRRL